MAVRHRKLRMKEATPPMGLVAGRARVEEMAAAPLEKRRGWLRNGNPPGDFLKALSGHTTISTFLRYNITSDEDKRSAMNATKQYRAALEKKTSAIRR